MVRWYRKRVAVNEDTSQQVEVYTEISDWNDNLYPTLFWEYFNNLPNFNTFTLVFTDKLVIGDDKLVELLEGRAKEGENERI